MYSPIQTFKLDKRTRKLLNDIDKMIENFPNMDTIKLNPQHFKSLLDSIPLHQRRDFIDGIPYKGKMISELKK